MKISTEIASAAAIVGAEKAIELVAEAGFDAWDFSMFSVRGQPIDTQDYLVHAKRLRKIGEECGIVCNQSHAPLWSQARDNLFFYMQARLNVPRKQAERYVLFIRGMTAVRTKMLISMRNCCLSQKSMG